MIKNLKNLQTKHALTALCGFNINADLIICLPEKQLKTLFLHEDFSRAHELMRLIQSKQQGEILLDTKDYLNVKKLCKNMKTKTILGGNAANIADELARNNITVEMITPWKVDVCYKMFSNPMLITLNQKKIFEYRECNPIKPHIIFETEKRRIIVTPKKRFRITNAMMKTTTKEYDIFVMTGVHLIGVNDAKKLLGYVKMIKARFKFFELGCFQEKLLQTYVVDEFFQIFDMIGMSEEEANSIGHRKIERKAKTYIIHSKHNIQYNNKNITYAVEIAKRYTDYLFRKKKITVGLGDRFSAKLIYALIKNKTLGMR